MDCLVKIEEGETLEEMCGDEPNPIIVEVELSDCAGYSPSNRSVCHKPLMLTSDCSTEVGVIIHQQLQPFFKCLISYLIAMNLECVVYISALILSNVNLFQTQSVLSLFTFMRVFYSYSVLCLCYAHSSAIRARWPSQISFHTFWGTLV